MARWGRLRWFVFFGSLVADLGIFLYADPFTPRSFMAAGVAAALFFVIAVEIALLFRGDHRIRRALVGNEAIQFKVGRHLLALVRVIAAHRIVLHAVLWPSLVAVAVSFVIAWVIAFDAGIEAAGVSSPELAQYLCGLYIPLLIATPFLIEKVSEWSSYQYVIVYDPDTYEARLLIHYGVLTYNLKTLLIERTVTTNIVQNWWESLIGYGHIVLRETAGGDGERLESLWRPRRLEREIRSAIKKARRGTRVQD